jgi:chromosome segregation ATPase
MEIFIMGAKSAEPVLVTVAGVIVSALIGLSAWFQTRRSQKLESKIQTAQESASSAKQSADLQRAEVEGWKMLIETTRNQYQSVVKESVRLQERLADSLHQIELMAEEADQMRERIAVLEAECNHLREELEKVKNDS